MKITVTSHGFAELEAVLENASEDAIPEGKKVVGQGCLNVKRDAANRVRGFAHLPHYPRSITYDVTALAGGVIRGEVGPDRARLQGKLGVFVEYGSPTSAPHPHLSPALATEAPKYERFVGELGEKLLER